MVDASEHTPRCPACHCGAQHDQVGTAQRESVLNLHRPPGIPMSIDEHEEDPRAISELNGTRLHYVIDRDALDEKMLHIFTSQGDAEKYFSNTVDTSLKPRLKTRNPVQRSLSFGLPEMLHQENPSLFMGGVVPQAAPPGGVPPNGGYIDLYEDKDWGGHQWRILEWETKTVGDFRKLTDCSFAWFGCLAANDQVTGVDAMISGSKPMYVLAEDINLGGSWFWAPGRSFISNLTSYGWNDRASSLMIMYFS